MTDIDFDELDQAVNSLMDQTPQKNTPAQPDAPQQDDPAPDEPEVSTSTHEEPAITSSEAATETAQEAAGQPVPANSIVPKRRGQFMDVMHPSSDMTTSGKQAPSSTRTGTNLAPLSSNQAPEQATTSAVTAPQDTPTPATDTTTMPDPIDMQPKQADAPKLETPPAQPPAQDAPASEGAQSPFLPDAKVEKTPLGSSAPTATPTDAVADTPPKTEEVAPAEMTETPSQAAPEKTGNTDDAAQDAKSDVEAPQQPAKPLPAEFASDVLSVESDTKHAVAAAPAPTAPEPPNSIVQQYKEKKTDSDTGEHAPIYDQATQPLDHPAKKKSGWIVIVFILLLIALGAGGAAAVYFFDLL